jgi:hypothetical protein
MKRTRNIWTTQEMKLLRRVYPKGGVEAVYEALRGRHTRGSIKQTAHNWQIKCEVPLWRLREANSKRSNVA